MKRILLLFLLLFLLRFDCLVSDLFTANRSLYFAFSSSSPRKAERGASIAVGW
jgi:hypothetical protein